jgi:hypothetical protein
MLRLFAVLTGFALSAFAQIDGVGFAAELQTKYGPPIARETFTIPAGEMVVDYASNGHVCRIQLPSVGPDERQPGVKSTKAVDDFLLKLLPLSMRGKELRRMSMAVGLPAIMTVEYENLTIAENLQGQERTGVTVTFAGEKCQDPAAR